jgi:UDP-N-acetylmuramate--alanine ligase
VIAVVQPHRYTRLGNLMDEFPTAFNDADMVYVAPVYAAGEAPIEGVDADALVEGSSGAATASAQTIARCARPRLWATQAATSARAAQMGDMVICMGAGDITKWAGGLA